MTDTAAEGADQACADGHCERAIPLLEEVIRRYPGDFRLHYRLGMCYGGSCRPHSLVSPEMAVPYFRQALRLVGGAPRTRADILDELAGALLRSPGTMRDQSLRAAIDCHTEAAEIYRSLGGADDWSRTKFNLGNSCCELSEITGENHWQEAIGHYEESLRVRTREKDAARYAAVLENLGSAYRSLPESDAGGGVRKSIHLYRHALAIYSRSAYPGKNAALQNNLGNAYLSLPETDDATAIRNARRALRHFDRALSVRSRDRHSRDFGITQYNRAQAYFRLARHSRSTDARPAVDCLQAALAAFQACGEDRYMQLVRSQLERLGRSV